MNDSVQTTLTRDLSATNDGESVADGTECVVAYMMSRFPKLTETFVLYEMLEAERTGARVEVYPLRREKTDRMHPEAEDFVRRAHFTPWCSLAILLANLRVFCGKPRVYVAILCRLVVANCGSLRYFAGALLYFPKSVYMAQCMRRRGVTHIHAHFASHPAAAAFVIHRLTGIPYSFTAHGSDLHCDRHMLKPKVTSAAFVVAISDYNRRLIIEECGSPIGPKILVVHCGVDTSAFTPRSEPTSFEEGNGPLQLLCIGTLHEVKGQRYLLQACRQLLDAAIDFQCHFVGEGPHLDMLRNLAAQLGLEHRVSFHGALTRGDVMQHLRRADILVAPSILTHDGRREGIPVVLMEAMACGVPCVSSQLSGIPELICHEKTGLLAVPGDVDAIADNIRRLHDCPDLRHAISAAAREYVCRQFDLPKNAGQLCRWFALATEGQVSR